jgi:hypothetical protein
MPDLAAAAHDIEEQYGLASMSCEVDLEANERLRPTSGMKIRDVNLT